jgi:hypothetical protein
MKKGVALILVLICLTVTLAGCTSRIQKMFRRVDKTAENAHKEKYR